MTKRFFHKLALLAVAIIATFVIGSGQRVNAVLVHTVYTTWVVKSKSVDRYEHGGWRNGPSGKGPSTLSINSGYSINRSFTNTVTGSTPAGVSTIGSSVGVTIGSAKTYGTSYSISIPKGAHRQIIFRSVYKVYKVVQRKHERITGMSYDKALNQYKTAYVTKFDHWDYSWKNI